MSRFKPLNNFRGNKYTLTNRNVPYAPFTELTGHYNDTGKPVKGTPYRTRLREKEKNYGWTS